MKQTFWTTLFFFIGLLSAQEMAEEIVHRRILFGFAGQQPATITRDGGWVELGKLSEPFQGGTPAYKNGRKWRVYAVYATQPSGGPVANIQIKFVPQGMGPNQNTTQPTFTLPQKESELDRTIDGFSDTFTAGTNPQQVLSATQVTCMVRLNTSASYNQIARLFWLELVAYDSKMLMNPQPPVELPLPEKEYRLKGKVLYKPWSKSVESWDAGGSDYCILETTGFENPEMPPFPGTIYLRPTPTVSFDIIKSYKGMPVEVTGILNIPQGDPNWDNLPEIEKGAYPIEMEMDEHGNMIEKPSKGPGRGKGIAVKSILGLAPVELPPVEVTGYTLQGKILVAPPVQGKQYNVQLDLKEFYPSGHPYFISPVFLIPSKKTTFNLLRQHHNKYVEVTGTIDPKDMRALIIDTIKAIEKPPIKDRIYVLQGKVVQKFWTKSMESWLAGGSDYCILDITGFNNPENPVSGAIYLRASEHLSYPDIRQYDGKFVEIRGVHDVPKITVTPDTMKGQYPVGPDGKPQAPSGSGDGIRVYEIREL